MKQIQGWDCLLFQIEMGNKVEGKELDTHLKTYVLKTDTPDLRRFHLTQTSPSLRVQLHVPKSTCTLFMEHNSERRGDIFLHAPPPPPATSTAWSQNVLPRLNLIITAANTMALNSSSRFFEGCRLHRHHNPLHLAHSLTHRLTERTKQNGEEGRRDVGVEEWTER